MNWNFLTDKYGFKLETVGDAGLVYSKALLNEFYIDINIEQHSYTIDLYKHNIIYFREIHNDNESDYVLTLINKIQDLNKADLAASFEKATLLVFMDELLVDVDEATNKITDATLNAEANAIGGIFSKAGKHIVCGGTTSSIAAKYLGKKVEVSLSFERSDVPPIAHIEGVDLVTEGVITMNKVIQYAKDYLGDNELYEQWNFKRDGASLICQLLFEEATDINFYVGRAVNPAHQNPDLPINFNIKMNLVLELSECLKKMGKRIKVSYF